MSQELVHIGNQPTELAQYEGVGFDGGLFKLKPMVLDLVQKQKKGKVAGTLKEKTGEGVYNDMHIVLLERPKPSKVMFPPGADFAPGTIPLCRSRDAVTPVLDDDRLQPQATNCKGCIHNKWGKDPKTGKKIPPACADKVTLFFVDRIVKLPFYLTIGGRSLFQNVPGVMTLPLATQEMARQMAKVKAQTGKLLNIFDFSMKITPIEVENRNGTISYVLGFSSIAPIKEEDRSEFGEMYKQYVIDRQNAYEAEEVEETIEDELSETPSSGNSTDGI